MISDLFMGLIKVSVSTSLMIVALLLLTPLLRKRYSAKWRYILWLVLAIRLLVPATLTLPQAPVQIHMPEQAIYTILSTELDTPIESFQVTNEALSAQKPDTDKGLSVSPVQIAVSIWVIGMFVFLGIHIVTYIVFSQKLQRSNHKTIPDVIQDIYGQVGDELRIRKMPVMIITEVIQSPVLAGLFRPHILLPHGNFDKEEIAFILRHELVHYRRRDLWYKLVLMLASCIHWFNPVVYFMINQAGKDIELSCDDTVIKGMNEEARTRYGNTILITLPRKRRLEPLLTTHFGSTKATIKSRLKNLFDYGEKRKGIVMLCVTVALTGITSGLFGYTSASGAAKEKAIQNIAVANLPLTLQFDTVEKNDTVKYGPFDLKANESYTVTVSWTEGGEFRLYCIGRTTEAKDSDYKKEYRIASGKPVQITVPKNGVYRLEVSVDKSITNFKCKFGTANQNLDESIAKSIVKSQMVSFDDVEIRYYDNGAPYIHDTIVNNTNKTITGYHRGMLAYDENGSPLELYWNPFDSSRGKSYYFVYDWGSEKILPGQTKDVHGGWSLDDDHNKTPGVGNIAYILYGFKEITFGDGTTWVNPDYDKWLKTYKGKTIDTGKLQSYYPFVQELN